MLQRPLAKLVSWVQSLLALEGEGGVLLQIRQRLICCIICCIEWHGWQMDHCLISPTREWSKLNQKVRQRFARPECGLNPERPAAPARPSITAIVGI